MGDAPADATARSRDDDRTPSYIVPVRLTHVISLSVGLLTVRRNPNRLGRRARNPYRVNVSKK